MIRKIITLSIVLVAVSTVFSLTGCEKEEPVKTDTEKVTEIVDDVMKDAAAEDHTGHNHE